MTGIRTGTGQEDLHDLHTYHSDCSDDTGRRVYTCHDRHLHVLPQECLESHPGVLQGSRRDFSSTYNDTLMTSVRCKIFIYLLLRPGARYDDEITTGAGTDDYLSICNTVDAVQGVVSMQLRIQ